MRGWAVEHVQAIARVKRSPKRTANWALAIHHSRGGMIHCFSERFKTRKRSFVVSLRRRPQESYFEPVDRWSKLGSAL